MQYDPEYYEDWKLIFFHLWDLVERGVIPFTKYPEFENELYNHFTRKGFDVFRGDEEVPDYVQNVIIKYLADYEAALDVSNQIALYLKEGKTEAAISDLTKYINILSLLDKHGEPYFFEYISRFTDDYYKIIPAYLQLFKGNEEAKNYAMLQLPKIIRLARISDDYEPLYFLGSHTDLVFDDLKCQGSLECRNAIKRINFTRRIKEEIPLSREFSSSKKKPTLPSEIWKIILYRRLWNEICSDISSDDQNLGEISALAKELQIPVTDQETSQDICLKISGLLAAGALLSNRTQEYLYRKAGQTRSALEALQHHAEALGVDTSGKTLDEIFRSMRTIEEWATPKPDAKRAILEESRRTLEEEELASAQKRARIRFDALNQMRNE